MENCLGDRRCLVCRRPTLKNAPRDPQTLVSNASLLQDFLNCFRNNILDSEVNDLSISCQFCPTCEKLIAEWSSIQTQLIQLTQLTRRATQLEATLSALLLSEPPIQEQNLDKDITEIINDRIQSSQEVELQETVDDIRNELRKKYSVSVMLDKISLSSVRKRKRLPLDSDDDEPLDHWEIESDDSDIEYLPCKDESKDEEPKAKDRNNKTDSYPKRTGRRYVKIPTIPIGPNRFKYKGMSFHLNEEDQTYTCDACGYKSGPKITSIRGHIVNHNLRREGKRERLHVVIPDGPNRFKYNGYRFRLNDEDQCYHCGSCNFKGHTTTTSILTHIRYRHYTAEEKIKFTSVKISETEWLYGGEYKIIKKDNKFKCVSCGSARNRLDKVIQHIRERHVEEEGPNEVVPSQEDTPSVHDSNEAKRERVQVVIPDGLNRFKYNGYDFRLNDEDQCYYCGICNYRGHTTIPSILTHIRSHHYTAEDKINFTAVKTSETEWLYGGKYQIIKVDNKFKCVSCGTTRKRLDNVIEHIRSRHVEVEGPLQEDTPSVDDSNEDSAHAMSDNMPLASVLNQEPLPVDGGNQHDIWDHWEYEGDIQVPLEVKLEPLLGDNEYDDKPWDQSEFGEDDSDEEYLPSEDELNDEEISEQILGIPMETEEETNCDASNSQVSADCKGMNVKAKNKEKQPFAIRVGPNRFKYNGYDVILNEEDQLYHCGACNLRGQTTICSILAHIRHVHYTAEDKVKFTAIKTSDTEWIYGGKYKIVKLDAKKFKCVFCGTAKSLIHQVVSHIRTQHVDLEDPDQVAPFPEKDFVPLSVHSANDDEPMDERSGDDNFNAQYLPNDDGLNDVETSEQILGIPSESDSIQDSVDVMSDNIPIPSELKPEPSTVDSDDVGEAWDHWECEGGVQVPLEVKLDPLLFDSENDDESWDHCKLGTDACDEGTSEEILGLRIKTIDEVNCDASNSQDYADPKGMNFEARKSQKQPSAIQVGPNRFNYNGYEIILNDEDQCYYCGVCNLKGLTSITSILGHIRNQHYTAEDKVKFTAIKTSDTEWIYGGKYKIIKLDAKKFKCVFCGTVRSHLKDVSAHIRTQHVHMQSPEEVTPVPAAELPIRLMEFATEV